MGEYGTIESLPGQSSETFSGTIGRTCPAAELPKQDLLLDTRRFDSEGYWAFCRFDSEEVPALRMGFQLGGVQHRQPVNRCRIGIASSCISR